MFRILTLNTKGYVSYFNFNTKGAPTLKWRFDGMCGRQNSLSDGSPAQCDPNGKYPCCSPAGKCSRKPQHCNGGIDDRLFQGGQL